MPEPAFSLDEDQEFGYSSEPLLEHLTFRTRLTIPDDGPYRFQAETLGGKVSLKFETSAGAERDLAPGEWVELAYGEIVFEVNFVRDGVVFQEPGGDRARLRILWERGGAQPFPPEPIPNSATRFPEWREGESLWFDLAGRVLVSEKGCVNCHLPSGDALRLIDIRSGPDLVELGTRASHDWLRRWIADPESVRPGAAMPRLFEEGEDDEVEALVHFLRSLASSIPSDTPAASEDVVLSAGRRLYHTLGCVACHGALDSPAVVFGEDSLAHAVPEVPVPAPFGDLSGKWFAPALARFLENPTAVFVDGRMPSMGLDAEEADLIANYLLSRWGTATPSGVDASQVARGRALFGDRGCVACHELPGVDAKAGATSLWELNHDSGCLDSTSPTAPHYALSDSQALSLSLALISVRDTSIEFGESSAPVHAAPAPIERARRTLLNLNCLACHRMDGAGGPPPELDVYFVPLDERTDLGDEGRLPPDLSNVGWKLQTSWLHEVLVGEGRARPYMATRMPKYGEEHVGHLADGLARMEGIVPHSDQQEPEVTDAMVVVGRDLMGRTALGCMACHVYNDSPPTGSPGPAITQFAERLRYEYFETFLHNPQRFLPGSRMPDFGTAGKSSLKRVYDGDMQRQIEAMWGYFSLGEFMPAPAEVELGEGLALTVGERPIVHRAFLAEAGSRAIAVGLPVGAHYAFDAGEVRLVDVWQGEFLDASGSWAGRGGTTLSGLGKSVWRAPDGPAFLLKRHAEAHAMQAQQPDPIRFGGYRLDGSGHPTFLYEVDGVRVAERIDVEVAPQLRISRRFHFDSASAIEALWFPVSNREVAARWRAGEGSWIPLSVGVSGGGEFAVWLECDEPVEALTVEVEVKP